MRIEPRDQSDSLTFIFDAEEIRHLKQFVTCPRKLVHSL